MGRSVPRGRGGDTVPTTVPWRPGTMGRRAVRAGCHPASVEGRAALTGTPGVTNGEERSMSDQARGDDVYQPQEDDGRVPEGDEPDLENTLDERGLDDQMAEGYSPPERPLAADRFGTTGEEEREGESLEQRLAQEIPDVAPPDDDAIGDVTEGEGEPREEIRGEERAGRLNPVDDETGRRTDVYADDVGIDGGAASAEEAAVHLVDEPEGTDGADRDV